MLGSFREPPVYPEGFRWLLTYRSSDLQSGSPPDPGFEDYDSLAQRLVRHNREPGRKDFGEPFDSVGEDGRGANEAGR
jgi:hypothetical protein